MMGCWQQEMRARVEQLALDSRHHALTGEWKDDPFRTGTVASNLSAVLRTHPVALSVSELASQCAGRESRGSKDRHRNAMREVNRALRLVRRTYGERYIEIERMDGSQRLAPVRFIAPHPRKIKPGGNGVWGVVLKDQLSVDTRTLDLTDHAGSDLDQQPLTNPEDLELQAKADRARARPRDASRITSDPETRNELDSGQCHPTPREPIWESPVPLEPALRAELATRLPAGDFRAVMTELRRQKYHLRHDETVLAARTLLERTPNKGWLALFRWAFNEARAGALVLGRYETEARTRDDKLAAQQSPSEALHGAPVALEAALGAELAARLPPEDLQAVLVELRRQKYHLRADETVLAARTLLERTPSKGWLALFRWAFNEACAGALLVDTRDEAERTRDCELEAQRSNPALCDDSWELLKKLEREKYGVEHPEPKEERWTCKLDPPRSPNMCDAEYAAACKQRDRRQAEEAAERAREDAYLAAIDALGNLNLPASELEARLRVLRAEYGRRGAALVSPPPSTPLLPRPQRNALSLPSLSDEHEVARKHYVATRAAVQARLFEALGTLGELPEAARAARRADLVKAADDELAALQ